MTANIREIRIATRESQLALWQAEHVAARLHAHYPHLAVHLVPMTTRGDQILDAPLAKDSSSKSWNRRWRAEKPTLPFTP